MGVQATFGVWIALAAGTRAPKAIGGALEALREGWKQLKVTMDELWRYAKVNRMNNVSRPYLEALTA